MTAALIERQRWVDIAKGIGIVLVVCGHVAQGLYLSGIQIPQYLLYIEKILYTFHMPLFFFISGIFVQKSLSRGIVLFFEDKVKVLLYPYFLWSLIHGSIQVILSPYTNDKLTLLDLAQVVYKPIAHFWFLQALFLCCIVYSLLKKTLPSFILVIIGLVMYTSKFFIDTGPIHNIFRMFLFFIIGSLFASISNKIQESIHFGKMLLIALFFLIFHSMTFYLKILDWPLVMLLAAFLGIGFIISLSIYFQDSIVLRMIGKLGFLAMPIYLAHAMGSAGARIILSKVFHIQDVYLQLLIGCIAGLAFPVLLFLVTNRLGFPWLFTCSKRSALSQAYTPFGPRQQKVQVA